MFRIQTLAHVNSGLDSGLGNMCAGKRRAQDGLHRWGKISNTPPWEDGKKKKTWWMRGELAVMRFYFQRIHSSLIWFGLWNWLALTDREGVNELQGSRVSMKEREPRARLWTTHGRGFFSSGETGETSEWRGLWIWRMVYACLDKHETWHARKNPSRLGLALSGSPSI